MKKSNIIILVLIFWSTALNVRAQEENKSTSKSMIAGAILNNLPNKNYDDESIGAYLSFRHNLGSEISSISINAGYIHYKDNEISKDDYIVTLGAYTNYNIGKYQLDFCSGIEFGIICKDIGSKKIRPFFSFNTGTLYRIYKNIGFEITFKVQYNTYDKYYCGIGAGLSYSF